MLQKSKVLVSVVTPLVITFLSFQSTFAVSNVTLKKGMNGSTVTELQKDLKSLGFMSTNPTGYFGDITKAAVTKFQKEYGLSADGIAGTKTLGKIDALQGTEKTVSRGTSGQSTVLKTGMTGAAVTELQKNLIKLGFMNANATGYYGDITKAAVMQLQKKYNLAKDGIAGKQTFNKIDALLSAKSTGTKTATVNTATTKEADTAATETKTTNEKATTSRSSSEGTAQSIINFAKKYIGVKYKWGGTTTKGFDCSGFTQYVFKNYGISINRVSSDQAKNGTYIKKENLIPGDLVFFDTNGGKNQINHVGIYIGGGKFIHSSSSHYGVTISSITSGFYANAYMTARRIIK